RGRANLAAALVVMPSARHPLGSSLPRCDEASSSTCSARLPWRRHRFWLARPTADDATTVGRVVVPLCPAPSFEITHEPSFHPAARLCHVHRRVRGGDRQGR